MLRAHQRMASLLFARGAGFAGTLAIETLAFILNKLRELIMFHPFTQRSFFFFLKINQDLKGVCWLREKKEKEREKPMD